jgi:hypothetical protein
MDRIVRARLTPSMGVAIAALIVAVFTGATVGIAASEKAKIKKIATKVVKKQAPKLSVKHATTADTAQTLQGNSPAAFVPAGQYVTTNGVVKLGVGATRTIATFGPFTITARCLDMGGGSFRNTIDLSSSEANSALDGTEGALVANASTLTSTTFSASGNHNIDLAAPGGAALSFVINQGVHGLGTDCFVTGFGFGQR